MWFVIPGVRKKERKKENINIYNIYQNGCNDDSCINYYVVNFELATSCFVIKRVNKIRC